jgi:hypothetical protein
MKPAFDVSGGAPGSTYALQEATADGFDAVATAFHQEHDSEGRHTTLSELDVEGDGEIRGALTLTDDLVLNSEFTKTLTGNTNNLANPDGSPITKQVVRLQGGSAYRLTGIVPPSNENHVRIVANGDVTAMVLAHNDSNSTAANRFSLPGDADFTLESGRIALLLYDAHSEIWRGLTPGAPMIRSLQRGTIQINDGASSNTATVTSVDTDKASLHFLGCTLSSDPKMPGVRLALTNATTITATRSSTTDGDLIVSYELVEYTG